jgi:NTE family protein
VTEAASHAPALPRAAPGASIALALGGGGARGLAHIVVLEALDELGIRPVQIAGTSIGAIIGAAYAAGIPGKALRTHVLELFRERARVIARLFEARVGRFSRLVSRAGLGNPVLVDGERILDLFWPAHVPDRFEALSIRFIAVAADYHLRSEVALASGPLTPAVGASLAIPGLVRPVVLDGRVLIDGGAVNPLPYEHVRGPGRFVVAIDVGGAAFVSDPRVPEPLEAMIGASQILMSSIVQRMVERQPPDLLIRPPVERVSALDFFKAREVLAACEPVKDEIKRALDRRLDGA